MGKKHKDEDKKHWPDADCQCLPCFRKKAATTFHALDNDLKKAEDRITTLENRMDNYASMQKKMMDFMALELGAKLAFDNSEIVKMPKKEWKALKRRNKHG